MDHAIKIALQGRTSSLTPHSTLTKNDLFYTHITQLEDIFPALIRHEADILNKMELPQQKYVYVHFSIWPYIKHDNVIIIDWSLLLGQATCWTPCFTMPYSTGSPRRPFTNPVPLLSTSQCSLSFCHGQLQILAKGQETASWSK